MKKKYLFLLMGMFGLIGVSCNSDEPSDASSKHVYAEGEAPYLRTVEGANVEIDAEIPVAKIDAPIVIKLKDYATYFHKFLNMTVDEALAGYEDGTVAFCNASTARGCWILSESTLPSADGWYYTANGAICNQDGASFSVELDKVAKEIILHAVNSPEAGTNTVVSVGFAVKDGLDFDDYMRFSFSFKVTDPTVVITSGSIPAGQYSAWSFNFNNCAENIEKCFGMTVKEFAAAMDNDQIDVYLVKDGVRQTNEDGSTLDYTSGWLGWWLDETITPVGWTGVYPTNFLYTEYGGDGLYNFGRPDGVATGTQTQITVDFVSKDNKDAYIRLIASLVFE